MTLADLKADSLRTLFIYLVPGAIAAMPWLCIFAHELPAVRSTAERNQSAAAVIVVVLFLTFGKILDGLGSWWEYFVSDRRLGADKKEFPTFREDWYQYLRTAFVHEPVAVGYIRNLTQELKFELNAGVGLGVSAVGILCLAGVLDRFPLCRAVALAGMSFMMAIFLLLNSFYTSKVLARVRQELAKGVLLAGDGVEEGQE